MKWTEADNAPVGGALQLGVDLYMPNGDQVVVYAVPQANGSWLVSDDGLGAFEAMGAVLPEVFLSYMETVGVKHEGGTLFMKVARREALNDAAMAVAAASLLLGRTGRASGG